MKLKLFEQLKQSVQRVGRGAGWPLGQLGRRQRGSRVSTAAARPGAVVAITTSCALAAALWLVFGVAWATPRHQITGTVVGISDGDTVSLLDRERVQHRIRLLGIDAPEKRQPYGERAKQHLARLAFSRPARAVCGRPDRYGRQVCQLFVDGEDVGLAQVREGFAWHYRQYQRDQVVEDRARYAEAEDEARAGRRGLWQDIRAVPPWEYRREAREHGAW